MSRDTLHGMLALASVALIAGGLWLERPSVAIVVVGLILGAGVIYARTRTGTEE